MRKDDMLQVFSSEIGLGKDELWTILENSIGYENYTE
jgi:hypothetical protein